VQRLAAQLAAALLAAIACTGALALPAGAQIAFAPCGDSNDFACGHLTVPIDPTGVTPGTITLAIRRHRAPVEGSHSAIIALAGGPGQSAIPFAEDFSELLGPIAATRDLIDFDQRGTGLSNPLSCHAYEQIRHYNSLGQFIEACASQLGPTRDLFSTADTVADIEAIRQAGGYEKLVIYGTSYGTKVAEEYAQAYPSHVEALILDSVVPPNGPEPLDRSTFAAIPRILHQLCEFKECAHITSDPVGDLARLVRRMHGGVLQGRVIDGSGHPHTVAVGANNLVNLLLGGDLEPILRSEFIAAVHAASYGDSAALARLLNRAESASEGGEESIDSPLYLATSCEDELFSWQRTASPTARLSEVRAELKLLPANVFAPFAQSNVLALSDIPACAYWPYSTAAPAADNAPLPNVPTLILSGADDLRTPTANAREVAAQIPSAHLLVVPNDGHAVLGTEPTRCAQQGLQAMFASKPIARCPDTPPLPILRPTPLPPAHLAYVTPARGYRGRTGETLQAVGLTLADFTRQFELQVLQELSAAGLSGAGSISLRSGGLRAGWAEESHQKLIFHGYSYVPGMTISGTIGSAAISLRIGGSDAAHGTLHTGADDALAGTLDGHTVHLARTPTATTAGASKPDTVSGTTPSADIARLLDPLSDALHFASINPTELQVLLASGRYCRNGCGGERDNWR
jgi:pimeloyl-ACP methyl ester carboxylesterase